jgi:hypothetical protein
MGQNRSDLREVSEINSAERNNTQVKVSLNFENYHFNI